MFNRHRRRTHRRRRHNPALRLPGGIDLQASLWGAGGAIGNEALATMAANFVPVPQLKMGPGRIALKVGTGLVAVMLAKQFAGRRVATLVGAGVGIGIALDVYKTWIAPMIPGAPMLSDFGEYTSEMAGLGADEEAEIEELGAYTQTVPIATFAPAWGA